MIVYERDEAHNIFIAVNSTLEKTGHWIEIIESLKGDRSVKSITTIDSQKSISKIFERG